MNGKGVVMKKLHEYLLPAPLDFEGARLRYAEQVRRENVAARLCMPTQMSLRSSGVRNVCERSAVARSERRIVDTGNLPLSIHGFTIEEHRKSNWDRDLTKVTLFFTEQQKTGCVHGHDI